MTGIDRVELAYLTHFLSDAPELFGLVRSTPGWLLLDRKGCAAMAEHARGHIPLPPAGWLARLTQRGNPARAQAETAARNHAVARAARPGLARLVRRLPAGTRYFNVGHANLSALTLTRLAGLRPLVMVHDTIPLDHPGFARAGTVAPFGQKLSAVSAHAHGVIHLTWAQRRLTEAQFARLGRVPPGVVAPLGVEVARPDPAALPAGLDLTQPWFVTVGTIEPRKNHDLLLDIWERLGDDAPRLFIIGQRGWASGTTLARLDCLPPGGRVQELTRLNDGAVAALVSGAAALLAPSLAEGFGLPPVEAAALGTPVIAADLAVTRELLGDKAVYLNPGDIYSWVETIRQAPTNALRHSGTDVFIPPSWGAHFKAALSLVGQE